MGEKTSNMERVHTIIKLGGAAITKKNEFETLNDEVLKATVEQLARVYNDKECENRYIIVHGAGSFGHFQASKGEIAKGGNPRDAAANAAAFAATRASVTKLNQIIVQRLNEVGVPAVGVSPFPHWTTKDRKIVTDGCDAINQMLKRGLVPVIHGDAVLDKSLGMTILGGDPITCALCKYFKPQRAAFLTDVPGVFDRPPNEPGARLLRYIERSKDKRDWDASYWDGVTKLALDEVTTATADHDTT